MDPRTLLVFLLALLVSGCASTVSIQNQPKPAASLPDPSYSLREVYGKRSDTGVSIVIAFSGGGARAAALSYGVLEELRDTLIRAGSSTRPLLDDVKVISSVSGGSFTAAYYGLFGERIFSDFRQQVLYRDLETEITERLLSIRRLMSSQSRGATAAQVYQDLVFGEATFADMRTVQAPVILINATDLSSGARISFIQDYFDLLCSDIRSFPVARAVAASAGIPVLFEPVVVENYAGCDLSSITSRIEQTQTKLRDSQLHLAAAGLMKIAKDKDHYRYLHLVDGGVTDNLGLRSIYEVVELHGGIGPFFELMGRSSATHSVLISVDASTDATYGIGISADEPSLEQTLNAVSDIQLHRYNASTLALMQTEFQRWNRELSATGPAVDSYFIRIGLTAFSDPEEQEFFNQIPTSLNLTRDQADSLVQAGRLLLRNHPEFKRLLASLN